MNGLQVGLHREGQGQRIVQETRLYDESTSETFSMRTKEGGWDVLTHQAGSLQEACCCVAALA